MLKREQHLCRAEGFMSAGGVGGGVFYKKCTNKVP